MGDPSIGRRRVRTPGRVVALLLIAGGATLLAHVGHELLGTGGATARDQRVAARTLDDGWRRPVPPADGPPPVGAPLVRIHVPRFGSGWSAVVLEGTAEDVLAAGPGHYTGTALPGEVGNVAVAGHRVTHGAPFGPADLLRPCDPIVLETRDAYLVYRVLPFAPEDGGGCPAGHPLPGPYRDLPGREVVDPDRGDVIAPVPGDPAATATERLLTLTTCHPRYSARYRLVIHAVLARRAPRSAGPPVELAPA